MRFLLSALLTIHGLIHLMGFAKAFGYARLAQLTVPISRPVGALWLAASLAFLISAILVHAWPRWWWLVAGAGVLVSMFAIVPSWADARWGALVNVLIVAAVLLGYWIDGPTSLRAQYERDTAELVHPERSAPPLLDTDLAALPLPVQRYLRVTGVLGHPRPATMHARVHGRIRDNATSAWMPLRAEQHNTFREPARLF